MDDTTKAIECDRCNIECITLITKASTKQEKVARVYIIAATDLAMLIVSPDHVMKQSDHLPKIIGGTSFKYNSLIS